MKFQIQTMVSFLLLTFLLSCRPDDAPNIDLKTEEGDTEILSKVDSANYATGIPIYHLDQGKEFWTEFNTQVRQYWTEGARVNLSRRYFRDNPYLEVVSDRNEGLYGVRMAFFKSLFDDDPLPGEIAERVTGLTFNALGYDKDLLTVQVKDIHDEVIAEQNFLLEPRTFKSYSISFQNPEAKEAVFFCSRDGVQDSSKFAIDDVYFQTNDVEGYVPPESDEAFLSWLKRSSFNFFDWNYVEVSGDRGVVLESNTDQDKVSLSGLGYAYAIFLIASEEGYITPIEAKRRIKAMMNWQLDQNWFDGSGGWHGFPHHYFNTDGTYHWADVSTIDWAICAAGLRVVRQYYADDSDLVTMAETLLSRPDWTAALAEDNKIAMGFDGLTGEMNDYRWALAFSEETELIYLEAVASGDLNPDVFNAIIREEKNGFYPSWFGAGFTYNWLQLWTGPVEPYRTNSVAAYTNDANTSFSAFGQPLMGLTACSTIKEKRSNGFLNWGTYISNQGGSIRGTSGSVIQVSPAPYGAALALPFTYDKAMLALRTYVELGYYHEYLGLPDNVRMKNLPEGILPSPNWDPYDINIGPIVLSIEQIGNNRVGDWYLSDPNIDAALAGLIDSFGD